MDKVVVAAKTSPIIPPAIGTPIPEYPGSGSLGYIDRVSSVKLSNVYVGTAVGASTATDAVVLCSPIIPPQGVCMRYVRLGDPM